MAYNIDAVPNHTFKKGDKVQHIGSGLFATVVEDQTDPTIIKINWDERPEGPQDYRSDAFRVAPWHGLNVKAVPFLFKKGDRVKLKYNRSCGTIKANAFPGDRTVPVEWDKAPGIKAIEELADLVVLYASRDNDPVNPNQEAIDAIEVQRQVLIKEVNAVQARLRALTTAKKLLERG